MITNFQALDLNRVYSYADYLLWQFNERLKLIKGKVFKMAAPTLLHQRVSRELSCQIANQLLGKTCEVFAALLDVCLSDVKK